MTAPAASPGYDSLWDWRRQVSDLYAAVRAAPDPEAAWRHWRAVRDGLFRTHPQTPIEPGAPFDALPFFPYDPALRLMAAFDPLDGSDEALPAGADGDLRMRPFARTRETYGAGRYLLDTIKGADLGAASDGRVVLDFNFAYNPSCSYSDRYVCPLAPRVNRLPAPVRAGERAPG